MDQTQNKITPQTAEDNANELKLRAIGIMADRNKDVRLSNMLTECKSVKAGSIISFGIDDETGRLIRKQMMGLGNTHIVVCMVIDAAELEKTIGEIKTATATVTAEK